MLAESEQLMTYALMNLCTYALMHDCQCADVALQGKSMDVHPAEVLVPGAHFLSLLVTLCMECKDAQPSLLGLYLSLHFCLKIIFVCMVEVVCNNHGIVFTTLHRTKPEMM